MFDIRQISMYFVSARCQLNSNARQFHDWVYIRSYDLSLSLSQITWLVASYYYGMFAIYSWSASTNKVHVNNRLWSAIYSCRMRSDWYCTHSFFKLIKMLKLLLFFYVLCRVVNESICLQLNLYKLVLSLICLINEWVWTSYKFV